MLCLPLVSGTWKLQLSALRALQPFITRSVLIKILVNNKNHHHYHSVVIVSIITSAHEEIVLQWTFPGLPSATSRQL